MKAKKFFINVFVMLAIGITTPVLAQTNGGRKKEVRNQRGGNGISSIFKRQKSKGHADAFAKGGHKKSFFAKIFKGKKDGSAWVYKSTKPGFKQNKEQAQLFSRNRTKNKRYRDGIIARQNQQRVQERGKSSFSKRKR